MNELKALKQYYTMYDTTRDKEQRELIKQYALKELEKIYGNRVIIDNIEFNRINHDIRYYIDNKKHIFTWSEATQKYYFENMTFSY